MKKRPEFSIPNLPNYRAFSNAFTELKNATKVSTELTPSYKRVTPLPEQHFQLVTYVRARFLVLAEHKVGGIFMQTIQSTYTVYQLGSQFEERRCCLCIAIFKADSRSFVNVHFFSVQ